LENNDCNEDLVPDDCQLPGNDCNGDGVPDECELAGNDCQQNGVPDECELPGNDCNDNGIPDECDPDADGDSVPDECDGCPNDPGKIDPGICGCGTADQGDQDGDGVLDCVDRCPGISDALYAPSCVISTPTVSEWGIVILALMLLLLVAGNAYFAVKSPPTT